MSSNNLQVQNTGLNHCYINGVPIEEVEIDIDDVYKKVARISSLAVHADPYFLKLPEAQKIFSELHGKGDRISADFLEEGARELLPFFIPLQRWIPEGVYDAKLLEYDNQDQAEDVTWSNPDTSSIFVDSVLLKCTAGYGDVTITVDGAELGTVSLPDSEITSSYLSYDLASYLGGVSSGVNYEHSENIRDNNVANEISLQISNASSDFTFDYKIIASNYDSIGWRKALSKISDVKLPTVNDNIRIPYLIKDFVWNNTRNIKVIGITLKHNSGSASITINYGGDDVDKTLSANTVGVDLYDNTDDIGSISITLSDASDTFSYDLIINTQVLRTIPSPRFEFDSLWNEDKIIYRFQNMDTRSDSRKLDYTSNTYQDDRVDTNTFDEVEKYINDSLKNYMLKELYEAIGHERKAIEYTKKYEQSRSQAKFWLRSQR